MIRVTRINDEQIIVSADLIEFIEATPDTMISLTTGRKILVKETVAQVIGRIVAYERSIRVGGRFGKRRRGIAHAPASGEDS